MYAPEAYVSVFPFSRQRDGEEFIVGRVDQGVFLALPVEAVEVLDDLASGKSIGETQALYRQRHGEFLAIEEFLEALEERGFIGRADQKLAGSGHQSPAKVRNSGPTRYHFVNLPQSLAKRLFGGPALTLYAVVTLVGLLAALLHPEIVPGRNSLFFTEHRTLKLALVLFLSYIGVFVHEMAHLLAAKAVGVDSRLGLSHRLWFLVMETDLTGLWAVPKKSRYLPLLAGVIVDLFSAAILLLILASVGWRNFHPPAAFVELTKAMVFTYLLRVLWQCYFYVRTDFYYIIAHLFSCRNLLKDTELFLRNCLASLVPAVRRVTQSVPVREMRLVKIYALVWVVGRCTALGALVFVSIPLAARYCRSVLDTFGVGLAGHLASFIDALVMAVLFLAPFTLGFLLWTRSLLQARRNLL